MSRTRPHFRPRFRHLAALAAGFTLLLPGPAQARTIDSGRASGTRATVSVSGLAERPRALRVHASSSPRRRVTVSYTVRCQRGNRQERTPARRLVIRGSGSRRLPITVRRAEACFIFANATIARGTLRVRLSAR